VTKIIAKKRAIAPIVKQTQWCINAKRNMLAMPLWGHTVRHYCTLEAGIKFSDRIRKRKGAPKFQNIPQHDYDHNSQGGYKSEVDTELDNLAQQIEGQKANHKAAVKSLRGELNTLSTDFRSSLRGKGRRSGGTHQAWLAGKNHTLATWYEPFSMSKKPEPRAFPGVPGDTKLEDKIKALVKAFGRWG